MQTKLVRISVRTSFLYWVIAALWILFSDRLLMLLVTDVQVILLLQTYKGWFFVTVTAILLYIVLRKQLTWLEQEALARRQAQERLSQINADLEQRVQEQREIRDALHSSEERLRLATEAAQIGTWERNLQTNQLTWSAHQEQLMGYEPGTFPNTYEAFFALVHPDEQATLAAAQRVAAETGIYQTELRFRLRDGRERWGLLRGQAIYDEAGQPTRLIGIDMDITERKRAEATLKQSHEQLRLMIEQAPVSIAMFDHQMRYLAASRHWKEDFHQLGQDFLGRSHYELFPDLPEEWKKIHQRALAGEILQNDDDEWVQPDGSRMWLRWAVHPWRDAQNEIGGIIISSEDISPRKQAEERLRESQQRLQAVVENMAEGLIFTAADGRLSQWNRAALEMHGMRNLNEALFQLPELENIFELSLPDGTILKSEERPNARIRRGEQLRNHEVCIRRPGTEWKRIFSYSGNLIQLQSGKPLALLTVTDITERKQAEEALRKSELLFRNVFNQQFQYMALLSPEGRVFAINDLPLRVVGVPREEYLGNLFWQTPGWRNLAQWQEIWPTRLAQAEQTEGPILTEDVYQLPTGALGYADAATTAIRNEEGKVEFFIIQATDTTERRRAEIALQISEDRLRQLHYIVANTNFSASEKVDQMLALGVQEFGLENGVLGCIQGTDYRVAQAVSLDQSVLVGFQCHLSDALCEEVIRRNELLALENIANTPWREHKACATFGTAVYFGVPVRVAEQVYGTVCFASQAPRLIPFTSGDHEFLRLLAQWIGAELTRHITEEALHKAEEQQRLALDAGQMGTWSWSPDTGQVKIDDIFCKLFDLPTNTAQISGAQILARIHAEDRDRVASLMQASLENRTRYEAEYRVIYADQSIHWINGIGQVGSQRRGDPLHFSGVVFEITKRKEAEKQLRLWADAFVHCTHGLAIGDAVTNRIVVCNPAFAEQQLQTVEEVTQTPILSLYAPTERKFVREQMAATDRTGRVQYESVMLRKDGTSFPVQMDIVTVTDEKGDPLYRVATRQDITTRKQSEERLRQSEAHFRALFAAKAVGSVECDVQTGRFLHVNQKMCDIVGYSAEELQQRSFLDITHPEDREDSHERYQRFVAGQDTEYEVEKRYVRKDGSFVWVGVTSSLLRDEADRPWHTVAVVQDITGRKQAEEQLRESEARFRTFFEQSAVGKVILDYEGNKVLDCNQTAARDLGYTREEMLGLTLADFVVSSASQNISLNHQTIAQGHNLKLQAQHRTKTGEIRDALVILTNIRIQGKDYVYSSVLDVTDQKRAEEELQRERLRLEKIAFSSPSVIYSFRATPDGEYSYPYVSAAFYDLYGFRQGEVKQEARLTDARVHPEDFPGLSRSIRESARNLSRWHYAWRVNHPDKGEIWVEGYSAPVREADGSTIWHGILNDVTERKQAEQKVRISEERLKLALAAARMGVWEWDLHTDAVYWSPECTEILGDKEFDGTRVRFFQFIHMEDQERVLRTVQQAIAEKTVYSAEFRFHRPDNGKELWLVNLGRAQYNTQGHPTRMVGIVQDITQRKLAETELEQSLEQIRSLASHLQDIREEERKRIARELHDELGQALAGLKFDLFWLDNHLASNDPVELQKCREKTHSMANLLSSTIEVGRKIATELRPRILDDLGLIMALQWQAREFQTRTGIQCVFATSVESVEVSPAQATALFRIFQETLTNVARHAQATTIRATLQVREQCLWLTVQDNGRGITKQEISGVGSLGLVGMRERVLPFGGEIRIQGQINKGTTVIVKLPLED